MILHDDFMNIGRGVDVAGLEVVILIIPMFYKWDYFKFTNTDFT